MKERLVPLTLYWTCGADKDPAAGAYVLTDFTVTHISKWTVNVSGTIATTLTATIEDDGTSVFGTISLIATSAVVNALSALTTPVEIAAGSALEIALDITGGSTPVEEGWITLWGYVNE